MKQKGIQKTLGLLETDKSLSTLTQDLSDLNLKKAIEAKATAGSNTSTPTSMMFGGLGSAIGGLMGGFAGAGAGGAVGAGIGNIVSGQLEQKGGQISRKVLDATRGIRSASTPISDRSLQNVSRGTTAGGTALLDDFLGQQRSEVNRKKAMQERGASR